MEGVEFVGSGEGLHQPIEADAAAAQLRRPIGQSARVGSPAKGGLIERHDGQRQVMQPVIFVAVQKIGSDVIEREPGLVATDPIIDLALRGRTK
jgi:hypothetical protein